jgi:adenylate kinase
MRNRLGFFVGGVHGVGKTTLIRGVHQMDHSLEIYDPGELFWKYHHNQPVLEPETIERMIAESLAGLRADITLINWHYAVWTPQGYKPQIPFRLLRRAIKASSIDFVSVIVTAGPATVAERRKKDALVGGKKRKLGEEYVLEEIRAQSDLYKKHLEILAREGHKKAFMFENVNREKATNHFFNLLQLIRWSRDM